MRTCLEDPIDPRPRVYFLRLHRFQTVKIGVSVDVEKRRKNLSTAMRTIGRIDDRELELIATIHGGYTMEGELHRRFEASRTTGEWFRMRGPVAAYVRSIGFGKCEGCVRFPVADWNLETRIERERRAAVADVLAHTNANNSEASRLLGISRGHLISLRRRYGL